jgi:hypothetical protein
MTPIEELRHLIKGNISQIPQFIAGSNSTDKFVWTQLQSIIQEIYKLTNEAILKDQRIDALVYNTNVSIDWISDTITDPDIEDQIYQLVIVSLENYLRVATDLELYEVSSNMLRFKTKFINDAK